MKSFILNSVILCCQEEEQKTSILSLKGCLISSKESYVEQIETG